MSDVAAGAPPADDQSPKRKRGAAVTPRPAGDPNRDREGAERTSLLRHRKPVASAGRLKPTGWYNGAETGIMHGWMRTFLRRWLLAQPECASASEQQRIEATDFVCREVVPGWVGFVVAIVMWIPIIFFSKYSARRLGPYIGFAPGPMRDMIEVPIGLLLLFLFMVLLAWLVRHRALTMLRIRLASLGVPLCRHCGYDLRGQTVPRCPECARAFDPALIHADRPSSAKGSMLSEGPP